MALSLKLKRNSFFYLNVTQFLGALNDNTFKWLAIYMLITLKGPNEANNILFVAGVVFVIPFLLFSSASGVLADRSSKRKIMVIAKIAEVAIMLLVMVAVFKNSAFGIYALLFLLAAQSAVFGPSKYGVIPEIVESKKISKANSILNSFTYLAIIIGTFLAAFVFDVTGENFIFSSLVCLLIAILGLFTVLKIEKTAPLRSKKRFNPIFIYEIYQVLKLAFKRKHLLPAIFGSAYFLFMGGYVQLNIVPYAMQSLHITKTGGGYLFLCTAVGIILGSLLVGKISKEHVELGISCSAGFFIGLLLMLLGFFPKSLLFAVILLILLGVFGGLFLIPFDAFIQLKSPASKRGQIIAAANFLSFVGVLLAACMLGLINSVLGFKAKEGFIVMGALSLLFNIVNTGRLSDVFFSYIMRKILSKSYFFEINRKIPPQSLLILKNFSWIDALSLFRINPNLKIIVQGKKYRNFPFFDILTDSIALISKRKMSPDMIVKKAAKLKDSYNNIYCLMLKKNIDPESLKKDFPHIFYLNTEKQTVIYKKFLLKRKSTKIQAFAEEV